MRRAGPGAAIVFALVLGIAAAPSLAETSGQALAQDVGRRLVGTPAPRMLLKTIDGQNIDLGALYGKKAVYLKFWATWCVPCRQQMPHFEHAYETAGSDLAVIAVDTGFNDSLEEVQKYRQKLGISMPIVIDDGSLGAAFGLRVTPQHIVIGRDGRVEYVGHLADARLDAALVSARSESAADHSQSAASPPPIRHYRVGDQLPDRAVPTIDGRRFRFHDSADPRPLVLVFLSPWCESYLATTRPAVASHCRRMREQVSELAQVPDVRWLGVASGLWATTEDLRDYRQKYAVKLPLTLDASGTLFHAFDISETPAALVVDRTGRIVRKIGGEELETPTTMRSAIVAL